MLQLQQDNNNPISYLTAPESQPPTQAQAEEQAYIKEQIIQQWRLSGTIVMKTARWKTHLIIWLISHFKIPTLILCHNIRNAQRTAEKIQEFTNIDARDIACVTSKIWKGGARKTTAPVTVTTHANFAKNPTKFVGFKQIIYDECDVNLSFPERSDFNHNMSSNLIMSDTLAIRGLTGTPYKDIMWQEPIIKIFWDIISKPDQENNGYNIIPHIIQLENRQTFPYTWTTWSELRVQMTQDEQRIQRQLQAINKYKTEHTIVLVELVAETDILYERLQQQEQPTQAIKTTNTVIIKFNGQLKPSELREQQERFAEAREKNIPYLIVGTIDMMWRWEDIPELETIFLFAPVKFEGTVVQAIGRWLRALPWKWEVVVYDWLDLPLLKKQAQLRQKSYISEYTKNVLIDKIVV